MPAAVGLFTECALEIAPTHVYALTAMQSCVPSVYRPTAAGVGARRRFQNRGDFDFWRRAQADAGCCGSVYRARAQNCIAVRTPTSVYARISTGIRAHGYAVLRALGIQTYRSLRRRAQMLPKSRRFRFLEMRAGRLRLRFVCEVKACNTVHIRACICVDLCAHGYAISS